jgi:hypothetical protein
MPSLHQLLPAYACIDHNGTLLNLTETTLPEVDTTLVNDAMTFHHDLADAEAARPASLTMTHAIVGTRQPTWTTIQISGTRATPLNTISGDNDYGDATVPLTGAVGHGLPMDTNTIRRVVDHHGHLQANTQALDELEHIITAQPVRRRAPKTIPVQVTAPDLVIVGDPLPITAEVEPDVRDAIQITIVDEHNTPVFSRRPLANNGKIHTTVSTLPPGGYEIRVTGTHVTPVTTQLLVWDPGTGTT